MNKTKKAVSFGGAVLSFVFLFNPTVALLDPLPDFIGYLILCHTFMALGDLNETVARARELFTRMVLIDIAKLVAILLMFGLSSGKAQEMTLLLVYFAFDIVEIITLIPAYKALFSGLNELGYRYENTSVLGRSTGNGKSYTDKAWSYTAFYVVFKIIICLLPELTVLVTHSEVTMHKHSLLYEYIGLLRGMAVFVCFVFGVIWLAKMTIYFGRIKKDRAFLEVLEREYRERVAPKEGIFIKRATKLSFLFIGLAALVSFDARLDGINVLPDVLSAVFLILGFLVMKKHLPSIRKYVFFALIYGVSAVASAFSEAAFLGEYYYGAIIRSEEAHGAYRLMLGCAAIEAIGFVFAVVALVMFLKDVIVSYTGFVSSSDDKYAKSRLSALHGELIKKLYAVTAGAVIAGFGDLFYPIGARYIGFAGLISAICSLVFFVILVYHLFDISDEINAKYMLE